MATREIRKANRPVIDVAFILVTIIMVILISTLLQDNFATGAQDRQLQQTQVQAGTIDKTIIENISGELYILNSKDWTKLAEHIGRPRATALLWYHLKANYSVDAKIVFGSSKKLDTAIAIKASSWSDSPFPTIKVKGVKYYIIDPMTPAIVSNFKYGEMFDDPEKTYLPYNYFRLFPEDIDAVEQWMKETGVVIRYTDSLSRQPPSIQNQPEYSNSVDSI